MTLGRMAVLQPFGFLAIEEVEVPAPTGHQVAIEMFAAAIAPAASTPAVVSICTNSET